MRRGCAAGLVLLLSSTLLDITPSWVRDGPLFGVVVVAL